MPDEDLREQYKIKIKIAPVLLAWLEMNASTAAEQTLKQNRKYRDLWLNHRQFQQAALQASLDVIKPKLDSDGYLMGVHRPWERDVTKNKRAQTLWSKAIDAAWNAVRECCNRAYEQSYSTFS